VGSVWLPRSRPPEGSGVKISVPDRDIGGGQRGLYSKEPFLEAVSAYFGPPALAV
jgi:hypothetical protein